MRFKVAQLTGVLTIGIFAAAAAVLSGSETGQAGAKRPAELSLDKLALEAAAIPVASFFDHSEVSSLRLSPDGQKIAFLFPHEGRRALAIFDRKTGEARMILRATNESFDSCEWKGNEHILAYADYHGKRVYEGLLTDLNGKKVVNLNERWHVQGILDGRGFDPERVVVEYDDGLYLLNVFTGSRRMVRKLPYGEDYDEYGWLVDAEGRVRILFRWQNGRVTLHYGDGSSDHFHELASWPFDGYDEVRPIDTVRLTGDGQTAYVEARTQHDRGALYAVNTTTGKWSEPLFVPPEGEIDSLIFSPDRNRLEGVSYEGEREHYHWFDQARATVQASLEAAFPGKEVTVVSRSADEQVVLVHVYSDRDPGAYFLLDRKTAKIDLFKRELLKLDARLMRPMEPFTFKARDGLELHAYLTRPWSAAKGPVPLVVHPHGGPFGIRDSWGFDRDVQFLASRGYAVVQVNYRGSGGYGAEFIRKGRFQWGRAMQDDLTDAVHWLVNAGIADPKRVAIFGASYGGYAALAGVTFTPDLYCCGVNYVGPADLEITFHPRGSDAFAYGDFYDYRNKWVGPDAAYRGETSPIRHIEQIRVPTLHAYGQNDPVIESAHWERLKRKLTETKKDFEFFIEKDQGHGFDTGEGSIKFYEKLDQFLARNLASAPR